MVLTPGLSYPGSDPISKPTNVEELNYDHALMKLPSPRFRQRVSNVARALAPTPETQYPMMTVSGLEEMNPCATIWFSRFALGCIGGYS